MIEARTDEEWEQQFAADHEQAERLRDRADWLTELRSRAAIPLGIAIALTPPDRIGRSALVATASIASDATDGLDGYYAKNAHMLDGEPFREKSVRADRDKDKKSFYAKSIGLVAREYLRGNNGRAAFLGANVIAVAGRDYLYSRDRGSSTNDHPFINRAKTALQMASIDIAVSPADNTVAGRAIANVAVLGGTGLAWESYRRFIKRKSPKTA